MSTTFLLMAQYGGRPIIPLEWVVRDFFSHLSIDKMVRKVADGDIVLPLVRIEGSAKAAKGVHLTDLAAYIDKRVEAARKECRQLTGANV